MRESIKAIKWCSAISMIFLVLTYAVAVNAEARLISFNSIWISNSFLTTLFGGVFASMLVVVLCEVQKYLSSKSNTEQYLFWQSLYLYQALMQMKAIIEDYLKHCEWRLPENLLDESVRMVQAEINALQVTDYATFKHGEDSLMVEYVRFQKEVLPRLQPHLRSALRLKLAISETKMEYLEKQRETHSYLESREQVTSASPRVANMLSSELGSISSSVALVDSYISTLDKCCHKRFKWDDVKRKMEFQHLDSFISTDV